MGAGRQRHVAFIVHADFTVCPIDLENAVRDGHATDLPAFFRNGHGGVLAGLVLRGHADIGSLVQIAANGNASAIVGQIEVVILLALFVAGDLRTALDIYIALGITFIFCSCIDAAAISHRGIAGDAAAVHDKVAAIAGV